MTLSATVPLRSGPGLAPEVVDFGFGPRLLRAVEP